MKTISNQALLAAAAGILVVGLAWASQIYASSPRNGGADPAALRRLAEAVRQNQMASEAAPPVTVLPPSPAPTSAPARPAQPRVRPSVRSVKSVPAVKPKAVSTSTTSKPATVLPPS